MTLPDALRQLSAKWREDPLFRTHNDCADELDALLSSLGTPARLSWVERGAESGERQDDNGHTMSDPIGTRTEGKFYERLENLLAEHTRALLLATTKGYAAAEKKAATEVAALTETMNRIREQREAYQAQVEALTQENAELKRLQDGLRGTIGVRENDVARLTEENAKLWGWVTECEQLIVQLRSSRLTAGEFVCANPECDGGANCCVVFARLTAGETPAKACCVAAPDRSGRSCDKPQGHGGDHWTYGGSEKTWAAGETPEPPAPTGESK